MSAMASEAWNTRTGNRVGSFGTQDEALAFVARAAQEHGAGYVRRLALVAEDDRGRSRTLATGADLVALVGRAPVAESATIGPASGLRDMAD